jgi:putative NADH-flavin reductase
MKVILYGATGMIGSRILRELSSRGHQVIAVARDTGKIPALPGVTAKAGDIFATEDVAANVKGSDAVVCAYSPGYQSVGDKLHKAFASIVRALDTVGVKRLIVVGGAGSLEIAPGLQLVDAPNFPAEWKEIALAHRDALEAVKNSDLDWTSLSPSALIAPGERTGEFRVGKNSLLSDSKGESRISAEDYAIALVDELESPKHIRQRFTAGY